MEPEAQQALKKLGAISHRGEMNETIFVRAFEVAYTPGFDRFVRITKVLIPSILMPTTEYSNIPRRGGQESNLSHRTE